MWCDRCKKEVDINSVAVNKARGALSMDIGGDVSPTMIHSTSNIVNVCKSCGESDYLFRSEASARSERKWQEAQRRKEFAEQEAAREAARKLRKSALKNPILYLLGLISGGYVGLELFSRVGVAEALFGGVVVFWGVFYLFFKIVYGYSESSLKNPISYLLGLISGGYILVEFKSLLGGIVVFTLVFYLVLIVVEGIKSFKDGVSSGRG